jgi:hypothetical protein
MLPAAGLEPATTRISSEVALIVTTGVHDPVSPSSAGASAAAGPRCSYVAARELDHGWGLEPRHNIRPP